MTLRSNLALATALTASLTIALSPLAASAKDKPLPEARKLMDAYVKALGGSKAIANNSDGTVKGTVEIVEAGIKGDMLMHQRGGDMVMSVTFPNFGETRMGIIGGNSWSIDPQSGPRLLQGRERAQLEQQNDDKFTARDKSLIASAATTAMSDSEGRACYRVEIEWKSGEKTADCYGVDGGLLLYTESTTSTPMGEIKQVSHMSDYKTIGGMNIAHSAKIKIAGMTQAFTMQSYENAKPGDDAFALPPSIDALIKKQSEAAGSK
jgi:hypothetical protein